MSVIFNFLVGLAPIIQQSINNLYGANRIKIVTEIYRTPGTCVKSSIIN